MSKLFTVAEGILDAEEYLEENTKSVEAVLNYAHNGCDLLITADEADLLLKLIKLHLQDNEKFSFNDLESVLTGHQQIPFAVSEDFRGTFTKIICDRYVDCG